MFKSDAPERTWIVLITVVAVLAIALTAASAMIMTGEQEAENAQIRIRVEQLERELWETEQARLACGQGWYQTMEALNYALNQGVK